MGEYPLPDNRAPTRRWYGEDRERMGQGWLKGLLLVVTDMGRGKVLKTTHSNGRQPALAEIIRVVGVLPHDADAGGVVFDEPEHEAGSINFVLKKFFVVFVKLFY